LLAIHLFSINPWSPNKSQTNSPHVVAVLMAAATLKQICCLSTVINRNNSVVFWIRKDKDPSNLVKVSLYA